MKPRSARRILAGRAARAAFGAALTVSFVVLAALALFEAEPTLWLAVSWPLAAACALVAFGGTGLASLLLRDLPMGGAARTPVSAASRPVGLDPIRRLSEELRRPSVIWPLVGLSLMLPLTSHLLVGLPGNYPATDVRAFDSWIGMSLVIVGHAHLLVAALAWRAGRRLLAGEDVRMAVEACKATGFAALLACVPGIVLIALPPILVAVTGIGVLPLSWALVARWHRNEASPTPRK